MHQHNSRTCTQEPPMNSRSLSITLRSTLIASITLTAALAGCEADNDMQLRREIQQLEEAVKDRDQRISSLQNQLREMNTRLQVARGISDDDLQYLFTPQRLTIMPLSGGEDYDEQPGHDGITVYLQPTDEVGDVLKVAGSIRVELFDLALDDGKSLVGRVEVPISEAGDYWFGDLWTYHYTIKVPWLEDNPPKSKEITIRATFTDYLSQRVMVAQAMREVELPQ
jgi:hypothetical protein